MCRGSKGAGKETWGLGLMGKGGRDEPWKLTGH